MAVYDGFFDATLNEETGEYDRAYSSGDFTNYFAQIIGSGVCVHNNLDSFLVRLEDGKAVVSPGYLFIQGYWLKNDADYIIDLPGTGNYAIVAHLNLGARMIELESRSVAQAYMDSLVLAIVSPTSAEDTRYNTDICGVISAAGDLSTKVEWAMNYIDSEIENKLDAAEQDIAAQSARLDAKIAEVQAVADSITPPPIGSIKFSASQDVGEEWLRCDGSFINEKDYPELVAALGKLTPSGDKFKLISDGEIGPQITNGALYGGRLWVYSYNTRKLYGIDTEGDSPVKEIAITSEDALFSSFIAPTTERPIALSIVPSAVGSSTKIFLCQIVKDGSVTTVTTDKPSYHLIFWADFSPDMESINMSQAITEITAASSYTVSSKNVIPYVVSASEGGEEVWYCAVGLSSGLFYLKFDKTQAISAEGTQSYYISGSYSTMQSAQRIAFSQKSNGEAVYFSIECNPTTGSFSDVVLASLPNGLYSRGSYSGAYHGTTGLTVPLPLNVVGQDKLLFEHSKTDVPSISTTDLVVWESSPIGLTLPSAARVFPDAAAYLWGKDIYLIFVGTGIIFSRTLEEGSFGYLDTTSVLGTITQFGYLDYDQDERTLYILGQDTTNTVKAAKIVLNTLYDYANDGAWLPVIAADGVPAYIKAVETEVDAGPTVPMQVTITNGWSEYVSVLFNGEKLIPGTYTRIVSESGKFSVGIRLETSGSGTRRYYLKLNGANAVSINESSGVGSVETESFYTQDYISGGITLTVSTTA